MRVTAIISILCWLVTIGGVCLGGLVLAMGFPTAKSAPQEAVVTTLACACAILPYCFARAVAEIMKSADDLGKNKVARQAGAAAGRDFHYKHLDD